MADMFTAEQRSEIMSHIRSTDTAPELALRSQIHRLGLRFRLHRNDLPGKPDLVLPKHRLVVMMHGCFWHGHNCKDGRRPSSNSDYWNQKLDRNVSRDKRNVRSLQRLGWRCLIVWECELRNWEQVEKRIMKLIGVEA